MSAMGRLRTLDTFCFRVSFTSIAAKLMALPIQIKNCPGRRRFEKPQTEMPVIAKVAGQINAG